MDCVVPKPSEVLFLISAGLWAEIFAPRALQSFENIRGEKRNANISTLRGFISKSAHQPCHFLIEKEVQKSDFQGSPPPLSDIPVNSRNLGSFKAFATQV